MIRPFYKISLIILFFLGIGKAFGQVQGELPGTEEEKTKPDDKADKTTGKSSFKFGASYLSNNVFMGRADTTRTPIILPSVKYTFSNSIYLSAGLNIIPQSKQKKIDGGNITAGYDWDITDDLSLGTSFSKLFYNATSTQISAATSATAGIDLTYDIGTIISPALSVDYDVNKQGITNDFLTNFGISHDFIAIGVFGNIDVLFISPTVSVNAGSQNFYDAYLTKKTYKNAKLNEKEAATLAKYKTQLGQFKVLDYEISMPMQYKTGHFIIQFTPIYAIAQNELPKLLSTNLSADKSIFYFQLGAFMKF